MLSWLEGRPARATLNRYQLDVMADALVELHSAARGPFASLGLIERCEQPVCEPPRWTTAPAVWERAFEILLGPIPTDDLLALVHRDFHFGNCLMLAVLTHRLIVGALAFVPFVLLLKWAYRHEPIPRPIRRPRTNE